MQSIWKKVGAALGSAVMIGATLAGAALAQDDMDLGDYEELMISDGSMSGMFVIGAQAATADVIGAINMGAWISNQEVSGDGGAEGDVVLIPVETTTSGVERRVEFDNKASSAYEFGASTATSDVIGPTGFASGDGVVNFLYSYNEKGPIYINGTDYQWHEEVNLSLTTINASRDLLESNAGDQMDEIFMSVDTSSMIYKWHSDSGVMAATDIKGKKMWFMGKEYTIISVTTSKVKLGAKDSEIVLTTANPTTTIGGVDVTLGGIYSTGTSGLYKAKITLTSGGTTETKYVTSGETETIASIEVYVKDAVVTTSGTNEGEAQMVVGAGVLKLTDGDYLEKGDGTETSWLVAKTPSNAKSLTTLTVTESQAHTAISGDYTVLSPGDSIYAANDLFALTYNGLTDQYGEPVVYRTINIQPEARNLGRGDTAEKTIRIRTPDENYIQFTAGGVTKTDDEIWIPVNDTHKYYWRNETGDTVVYSTATSPTIKLTTAKQLTIGYWNVSSWAPNVASTDAEDAGYLSIWEPALSEAASTGNITVEYNNSKFDDHVGTDFSNDAYYAYYKNMTNGTVGTEDWFGRLSNYTTATRDFYTKFGIYVKTVGQYLITLEAPEGQSYAEFIFGTQQTGEGEGITCTAGATCTVGGTVVNVSGAVSGLTPATLGATLSKLDSEVTAADKGAYTLVLVGGPAVNTLVGTLQTEGKLEKTIGSPGQADYDINTAGAGVIELVADAWGTGKYAIVVAGSDRAGTNAAANKLANFDAHITEFDGEDFLLV